MGRAAGRTDPQGWLRLRRADVRALQVRRHDHQQHQLPAHPRAVRDTHPPADRRGLRRLGGPGGALPRARLVRRAVRALRDRHLDDALGHQRGIRRVPGPARREDPRRQGPGQRPGADVPPGRRHAVQPRRPLRRPLAAHPRLALDPRVRLRARRGAGGHQRQPRQARRQSRAGAAHAARHVGRDARSGAARSGHVARDRHRIRPPSTSRPSCGSAASTTRWSRSIGPTPIASAISPRSRRSTSAAPPGSSARRST